MEPSWTEPPRLVEKSFRKLERGGLAPMTMFSNDGTRTITIDTADLQAIAAKLRNSPTH